MEHSKERILLITTLFLLCVNVSKAVDCELNNNDPHKVAYTIVVDKSGSGNFSTIQSAIDFIPSQNTKWIRIQISSGIYVEKVKIASEKSCIFLDGAGSKDTEIQWNDHASTATSATFTSVAENLVVQGITFKNTYNANAARREDIAPALAVLIEGDKAVFHMCSFIGVQDTLWDGFGRHHFTQCYIQGAIDVISGSGQSIYQKCEINMEVGPVLDSGYITAQGKDESSQTNGFVFIECSVSGSGKVYLGRAYRAFSTVIYHLCSLSACIDPTGWDSWNQPGHESSFTYAESGCIGPGADTSKRVPWVKKLTEDEIKHYTDISFIDQEGWTLKLPLFS